MVMGFMMFIVILLNANILQACPGCNAALDSTLGQGFNMSILFLMSMPFFVVGAVAGGVIFMVRNKKVKSVQTHINQNT